MAFKATQVATDSCGCLLASARPLHAVLTADTVSELQHSIDWFEAESGKRNIMAALVANMATAGAAHEDYTGRW